MPARPLLSDKALGVICCLLDELAGQSRKSAGAQTSSMPPMVEDSSGCLSGSARCRYSELAVPRSVRPQLPHFIAQRTQRGSLLHHRPTEFFDLTFQPGSEPRLPRMLAHIVVQDRSLNLDLVERSSGCLHFGLQIVKLNVDAVAILAPAISHDSEYLRAAAICPCPDAAEQVSDSAI